VLVLGVLTNAMWVGSPALDIIPGGLLLQRRAVVLYNDGTPPPWERPTVRSIHSP